LSAADGWEKMNFAIRPDGGQQSAGRQSAVDGHSQSRRDLLAFARSLGHAGKLSIERGNDLPQRFAWDVDHARAAAQVAPGGRYVDMGHQVLRRRFARFRIFSRSLQPTAAAATSATRAYACRSP